ncbi:CobW family GTP-binding protein [Oceanibacterium hippocampi]|uniref:Putative GTP-binding protein YjiA n=1 Tax=Oceanibacterium hippocampi TaxID=745714 RepID=A0A1Y5TY20_9PROT|nr:GTP-binding protein [Oceanibacterium hippocampi]SLN75555.1 putative GTP-binding protein YjiA [Oceanibacterium hippocampi]
MSIPDTDPRIPVLVLTGFLGSGKSTLLRPLLQAPQFAGAAVIVNEMGEIPIDHLLIDYPGEDIVLLDNGCLCCALRSDLSEALERLYRTAARDNRTIPSVLVETTGLASPAPIVRTFATERNVKARFRLASLAAAVDAEFGEATLKAHQEAVHQVVFADELVITKADKAEPSRLQALSDEIRRLNPHAPIRTSGKDPERPADLLWERIPSALPAERWARLLTGPQAAHHHAHGVETCAFEVTEPFDWPRLADFLGRIVDELAPALLRCKGVINIAGVEKPVVIHGVHHIFYPPETLEEWPDASRRSRLVFILDGANRRSLLDIFAAAGIAIMESRAA